MLEAWQGRHFLSPWGGQRSCVVFGLLLDLACPVVLGSMAGATLSERLGRPAELRLIRIALGPRLPWVLEAWQGRHFMSPSGVQQGSVLFGPLWDLASPGRSKRGRGDIF